MTVQLENNRRQGTSTEAESDIVIPEVGVLLYDNPNECTSGHASVNGSPATHVRQHSDLANNVIWITNGAWSQFMVQGHRNVHNLRGSDFFRTNVSQIGADLGLDMSTTNSAQVAPTISLIASRTFKLLAECYEWKPNELANAEKLHQNIRSRFPRDVSLNNPALERGLLAAYQTDSALSKADFIADSIFLTLRMNRLAHAKRIMSCPVPEDAWEYIPGVALPSSQRERLAFCLGHEHPVLAEVLVDMSRADSQYAALSAFGQKASSRMVLREWVSHPELHWLSRFAPLEIKSVFRSSRYVALPDTLQLPAALTSDPLLQLSYSAGLLAENHWMSLASDEYNKITKRKTLSSRAVWLRAADRALCFALAKKAVDKGFVVTGYGTGAVRVRIQRSELFQALEFAIENQLVAPNFGRIIHAGDVDAAAAA
uniref:hypothetical protein n=1 Tax=Cupriavidus gilardii TaxID=82541 RepID=UPI00247845B0|nr:hypothetical protein [Cupriavidus gilardii]WDE72597.1 hypothetical protein [Cupriavidus gilardii]